MRFDVPYCSAFSALLCAVALSSCASSVANEQPPIVKPLELRPPELLTWVEELSDEEEEALPLVTQPAKLKASLEAIASGPLEARVERLKQKALKDLVFIEGGQFVMGDWGNYVAQWHSYPVHPVNITSFYMSRFQVTFAEFDTYTDATKTPRTAEAPVYRSSRHPLVPAGAIWQQARDYCQWVGQITGLPFDLPTEAQWEYAARSRGMFVVFPTDDGTIKRGTNVPGGRIHRKRISPQENHYRYDLYPIGMFPPNSMGLYDLSHNGYEWMLDWYNAEYYKHSPADDPKGPETGEEKVLRSRPNNESIGFFGITASRYAERPDMMMLLEGKWKSIYMTNYTLRCVVNTDKPLPK